MLGQAGFVDVQFDRHYAGGARYETVLPTHAFTPGSRRVRTFKWIVDRLGAGVLHRIQALGLADGLHGVARRPTT